MLYLEEMLQLENACFGQEAWTHSSFTSIAQAFPQAKEEMVYLKEKTIRFFHLSRENAEGAYVFATLWLEEQCVAYAVFFVLFQSWECMRLATFPQWQNQGLAKLLFLQSALFFQMEELHLEVRASNEKAQKVYMALGFEKVGERKAYYENPKENAYLYTRNGRIFPKEREEMKNG